MAAARRLTCAALNQDVKPAVVSGIMKYHATERMRTSVNEAMDVHAGRGVIDATITGQLERITRLLLPGEESVREHEGDPGAAS